MKQCQNCKHYNPLKDNETPAGWCEFIESGLAPFWMEKYRAAIDNLGADVSGSDGNDCGAFTAS